MCVSLILTSPRVKWKVAFRALQDAILNKNNSNEERGHSLTSSSSQEGGEREEKRVIRCNITFLLIYLFIIFFFPGVFSYYYSEL